MASSPPRGTAIPSGDGLSALVETTPASGPCHSITPLATVATLDLLLFGYDTRVITGVLPYMYMPPTVGGLGSNEFDEDLVGATLALGTTFGAIPGGRISDSRGRRFSILLLVGVFITATLGCTLSPNIPALLFFRFILDWVVGGASAVVPIYLSESAPTRVRDQLAALDQLMTVFGQLLTHSMNAMLARGHGGPHVIINPAVVQSLQLSWDQTSTMTGIVILSGNGTAWRWMLVLATIPAIFLWVGMRLMPESGRWYAANLHYARVTGSLKQIRDPERDDIASEIRGIVDLHEHAKSEGT